MRTKIPYYFIEFNRIKAEMDNDIYRKTNKGEVLFRSLKMKFLEETFRRGPSLFNSCTSLTTVEFPSSHVHAIRSLR